MYRPLPSSLLLGLAAACTTTPSPEVPAVTVARGVATAYEIDALAAFARLYGYVRFFHPSDAAAASDWDAFAIAGVWTVSTVKDLDELRYTLQALVDPIAPTVQIYREGEPAPALDLSGEGPTVAWRHRGFGFGTIRSAYTSARTNRAQALPMSGRSKASLAATIDACRPGSDLLVRARAQARRVRRGARRRVRCPRVPGLEPGPPRVPAA